MPCTRHELYRVGFADHMKSHAMRWAAPHMLPLLLLHVIVMSIPFTLHLCLLPLSFRFLFKLINAYRLINNTRLYSYTHSPYSYKVLYEFVKVFLPQSSKSLNFHPAG